MKKFYFLFLTVLIMTVWFVQACGQKVEPTSAAAASAGASTSTSTPAVIATSTFTLTPTLTPSMPTNAVTISTGSYACWAVRTAPNGNLWVTDRANNKLEQITATGLLVGSVITTFNGSHTFNTPDALSVDSSGNVYVADTFNYQFEMFNSSGTWLSTFGSAQLAGTQTYGVEVNAAGTTIYGGDSGAIAELLFSVAAGSVITYQSTFGNSGAQRLSGPAGGITDSLGNLWLADQSNNRIVKYSGAGVYQSAVTLQFSGTPQDVAVDLQGNIFAVDSHNQIVQEFNAAGQFLYSISLGLNQPTGVSLDTTGNYIYVADFLNERIILYKIH
jgi:tripartite motif-containing protein 71